MQAVSFVPIIKPVGGRCNLACSYCYFHRSAGIENQLQVMPDDILKALIDFTCESQERVEFIWHGGEPLLAGIEFYQKAIVYEIEWIKKGKEIVNSIQTNGVLIDELWISFLAENNFTVSISLDGPQHLHDASRYDKLGRGSYFSVSKAINLLKEASLLTDVICCVGSHNYHYPGELFDFLIKEGAKRIKFLQVQGRGQLGRLLPNSISGKQYATFLIEILERWLELDDPSIDVRELTSIVNVLLGGEAKECMFSGNCHNYFTIYPNGQIYGCDSLPQIEKFNFGSITDTLKDIHSSFNYQRFCSREKQIRDQCSKCDWFSVCRGGCLQDWYPNIFDDRTKNLFCSGLQKIFTETEKILKMYNLR